jgi:hypothetical protein
MPYCMALQRQAESLDFSLLAFSDNNGRPTALYKGPDPNTMLSLSYSREEGLLKVRMPTSSGERIEASFCASEKVLDLMAGAVSIVYENGALVELQGDEVSFTAPAGDYAGTLLESTKRRIAKPVYPNTVTEDTPYSFAPVQRSLADIIAEAQNRVPERGTARVNKCRKRSLYENRPVSLLTPNVTQGKRAKVSNCTLTIPKTSRRESVSRPRGALQYAQPKPSFHVIKSLPPPPEPELERVIVQGAQPVTEWQTSMGDFVREGGYVPFNYIVGALDAIGKNGAGLAAAMSSYLHEKIYFNRDDTILLGEKTLVRESALAKWFSEAPNRQYRLDGEKQEQFFSTLHKGGFEVKRLEKLNLVGEREDGELWFTLDQARVIAKHRNMPNEDVNDLLERLQNTKRSKEYRRDGVHRIAYSTILKASKPYLVTEAPKVIVGAEHSTTTYLNSIVSPFDQKA